MQVIPFLRIAFLVLLFAACNSKPASHNQMLQLLQEVKTKTDNAENIFAARAQDIYYDSLLQSSYSLMDEASFTQARAHALLQLGEEQEAITLLENLLKKFEKNETNFNTKSIKAELALAYLRLGERSNCVMHHSAQTCIFPIQGSGIHTQPVGSQKAVLLYQQLLTQYPDDLNYKWLINLAYMTLGQYENQKANPFFLPGLITETNQQVKPFTDVATHLKLDIKNMGGGSIAEDFDNDGYIDLVTSSWDLGEHMHYFKNNGDGSFQDLSTESRLKDITGGLNIMQTDYNNDGYKDVFVLRGAWLKGKFGNQPNSLLKNNGDGTFTDVTTTSGLLSLHPSPAATWNDFNNDGWVDVFIGNEHRQGAPDDNPCELFINNGDGTFTNIAKEAACDIRSFVKGVTSGDYNNDGRMDIFISTMEGKRYLLKNNGIKNNRPVFKDVTAQAKLDKEESRTFPTWFWDYNNDGWLDILVCDYNFEGQLSYYAASEALNLPGPKSGIIYLYKNNQDGTFSNITEEAGLNKTAFAMGANFGDIDNDGFLDFYLGTGNPDYESIIPNKMFKNVAGKRFEDVTNAARVGHLQKGHGISFADMDNDGDQDIHIDMGGAYIGDAYQSSFFLNPGQNNNRWINLQLIGTQSNKSAIGSRIKITFKENGITRSVYRDVNSGGSFGASPFRREIGIGQAIIIDAITIQWHGSNKIQTFRNIKPNQFLRITEGNSKIENVPLQKLNFEQTKPVKELLTLK
ncbi:CRTAC1 family protein [Adhaeribacter aquaticus]|uniref:CRTAC1 family protein n=1 Tax=Adhaeribacter aquaticus TaxID=299567 RepID=UPI00041F0762|nr:CRTAC1 family protein [Adhaeribacter aquaticus]